MDKERAEILLYNAICGLEENGFEDVDVIDYLGMSEDEYVDLMGVNEEENWRLYNGKV